MRYFLLFSLFFLISPFAIWSQDADELSSAGKHRQIENGIEFR